VSKRQKERTNQNRERRLGSGDGIARPKGGGSSGIPLWMWALSLSGFLALGVVIAVVLLTRGGSNANTDLGVIAKRDSTAKIDFVSQGTWRPVYTDLAAAIKALNLPAQSDVVEHYHVHIRLVVDGNAVPIPNDMGIDQAGGIIAAIHTHEDDRSLVHVEAGQKGYRSDLQNVFDIWGVRFNARCVGGYCGGVKMWVNGVPSTALGSYLLQPHDVVTILEGTPPAGFKPSKTFKFLPGE
jgi:hypothetical protein